MQNNNGFTLLEMLIVLLVISITSSFIISNTFNSNLKPNNEITILINEYNTLKTKAITNKNCMMVLSTSGYICKCDNYYKKYKFITDLKLTNNFSNNTITFNEVGNITKAGTITFNNEKKLSFSIMTGVVNEK